MTTATSQAGLPTFIVYAVYVTIKWSKQWIYKDQMLNICYWNYT